MFRYPFMMHRALLVVLLLSIAACSAPLPKDYSRSVSHALPPPDAAADVIAEPSHREGQSGLFVIGHALDGFVARMVLIQQAQRSIDAQYYLLADDTTGHLFLHGLLQAAERGVRVRLLLDDIDLADRDPLWRALDGLDNFELRIFNPLRRGGLRAFDYLARFATVERRMHNKSFTVDNRVTLIGGRNIGDHYFSADRELAFLDLDLMAVGAVVPGISAEFDTYWNDPLAYPASTLIPESAPGDEADVLAQLHNQAQAAARGEYAQAVRESPLATALQQGRVDFVWGRAEAVFDDPKKLTPERDDDKYLLSSWVEATLRHIESELILFSAYFVPSDAQMDFFRELRARGVRVRILTNSLASTDVAIVHAGYAKRREALLRMGVELYEFNSEWVRREGRHWWLGRGQSKASLHEKAFVVDRRIGFIGSMNFDPRSFDINTEIGIFFDIPEEAERMADWFDRHIDRLAFRLQWVDGAIVWHYAGDDDRPAEEFDSEPHAGLWRRIGVGLMGLLPIDAEL